ncbi:hypothetical protein ZWY2020_008416 [Hordeum vulgare]|nr:hypothetical protein ZWY2020_008416 [Hordeum vulgare]
MPLPPSPRLPLPPSHNTTASLPHPRLTIGLQPPASSPPHLRRPTRRPDTRARFIPGTMFSVEPDFYEDFSLFTHYNLKKQQPPSMDEKDDPTPKPDDLDLDQATTSGTLWFHGWHR